MVQSCGTRQFLHMSTAALSSGNSWPSLYTPTAMYRWVYRVLSGCGLAIMQRRLSRSYNIPGMPGTSNSAAVATAVMAGGLTTLGMRLRFNMCSCIWLRLPKSLCTSASLLPDTVRLRALHSSLSLTTGSLLRSSIFHICGYKYIGRQSKMEVDICCGTFPWSVIGLAIAGDKTRSVFDVALRGLFFTADAQAEHLRYSGGSLDERVAHCRAVRTREDQRALEHHIYMVARAYMAQHSVSLGVRIACGQYPHILERALARRLRCSRFASESEALSFYARALTLFSQDPLAMPLGTSPHVTREQVNNILAHVPASPGVTMVPDEVRRCPEEVGRHLFVTHIRDIAAAKVRANDHDLLQSMLEYAAGQCNRTPLDAAEAMRRLMAPDRAAETAVLTEDLRVMTLQQKLPLGVAAPFMPLHLSDPTLYLSSVDQINQAQAAANKGRRSLSCDDTLDPFVYKGTVWRNILDAATYWVCYRMDPLLTPDMYSVLTGTVQRQEVYNNIFNRTFDAKLQARLTAAATAKYQAPSEQALLYSLFDRVHNLTIVCRTGNSLLDNLIIRAFMAAAHAPTATTPISINDSDLSTTTLVRAWLQNVCSTHRKHYTAMAPPRPPTRGEVAAMRHCTCPTDMFGVILRLWQRTISSTTLTAFAEYLCERYIDANRVTRQMRQ
ncbi:ORF087 [Infectious spleen and kidney necrosis virus]|nr:ORF087 [Infectious spleen and kidney necrosis virus]